MLVQQRALGLQSRSKKVAKKKKSTNPANGKKTRVQNAKNVH